MELNIGIAARERQFSRAWRRVRSRFDPLVKAFAKVELANPIHRALLVGITDEKGTDYFEEIPNDDSYFQVLAGCAMKNSDLELSQQIFNILRKAASLCPFSIVDHESIQEVFDEFEPKILAE